MKKLLLILFLIVPLFSSNKLISSDIYNGNAIWTFEAIKTTDDAVLRDTLTLERSDTNDLSSLWNWRAQYSRTLKDGSTIKANFRQELRVVREEPIETGINKIVVYRLDLPVLDYLEDRLNQVFPPVAFQKMNSSIFYQNVPVPTQENNATSITIRKKWTPNNKLKKSDTDTSFAEKDMSYSVICDYEVTGTTDYKLKNKSYKCWVIKNSCYGPKEHNFSKYYYSEKIGFVFFFIRFPDYTVQIKLIHFKEL